MFLSILVMFALQHLFYKTFIYNNIIWAFITPLAFLMPSRKYKTVYIYVLSILIYARLLVI